MRPLIRCIAVVIVAGAVLSGCGGDSDRTASTGNKSLISDAGPQHVHGLGINPADGGLYIATHSGLWLAPAGQPKAKRVPNVYHDLMGFTVVGPDRFLATGHPDARHDLPPQLGLQRSSDGGRSWQTVSLLGKADLHVLRAAGRRVYGVDSGTGALLASADGGRSWQQRTPPGPVFDLAIAPGNAERLVAATDGGLFSSATGGRTWRALSADATGLLAWPTADRLYLATANGTVVRSTDGGRHFARVGAVDVQPEAFTAHGPRELYAAVHGGHVVMSRDGGAHWQTRSTP